MSHKRRLVTPCRCGLTEADTQQPALLLRLGYFAGTLHVVDDLRAVSVVGRLPDSAGTRSPLKSLQQARHHKRTAQMCGCGDTPGQRWLTR
ncbi:MAG: hypothetical protein RLZZ436_451 [Planctomycetota bacterium]